VVGKEAQVAMATLLVRTAEDLAEVAAEMRVAAARSPPKALVAVGAVAMAESAGGLTVVATTEVAIPEVEAREAARMAVLAVVDQAEAPVVVERGQATRPSERPPPTSLPRTHQA
jgi:hypothetical protein